MKTQDTITEEKVMILEMVMKLMMVYMNIKMILVIIL